MKAPDLGQMIGPLPLGGWVAVVGGGVGLAVLGRRAGGAGSGGAAGAATAVAEPTAEVSTSGVVYGSIPRGSVGLPSAAVDVDADAITTPEPTTNDAWMRDAVITLVGRGYGAFQTQNTLSRYLEGQPLTSEEQIIVEAAIRAEGPPPLPPISIPPQVAVSPVPAPTVPTPTSPAPAPPPAPVADFPPPPPGFPGVAGEVIIEKLVRPEGGGWYVTNLGGVANVGGAPFLGSAFNNRMGPGFESPPRYIVNAVLWGRGYQLISNRGETYTYG